MKLHEKSTQRFVKEYCNYKISWLKDLARQHPEHADEFKGRIVYIERRYKDWETYIMGVDEAMRLIAEA